MDGVANWEAPPNLQPPISWAEQQFRDTPLFVLILLAFCCNLVALIFSIIVLATGVLPEAKRKAQITLITCIVIMIVNGIFSVFYMIGMASMMPNNF